MRELIAGFRRGRARSYAEHGPPPPFIQRRRPPQPPPPGQDDAGQGRAEPLDIPLDAPSDAPAADVPLDDALLDDAAGAEREDDKQLIAEMAKHIEELEARAADL